MNTLIDDTKWRHCESVARLMSFALSRLDANDLDGFQRLAERAAEEITKGKENAK